MKRVSVGYVPGLSRNLLSSRKAVEQGCKPLYYYKPKAVLGFPGEEPLVFNFFSRKGLCSVIGVRRNPSQEVALGLAAKTAKAMRIEGAGQWGPCADGRWDSRQEAALAVVAKVHDTVEVHRVLAHPSEEITQKTVQAMESRRRIRGGPARRACR